MHSTIALVAAGLMVAGAGAVAQAAPAHGAAQAAVSGPCGGVAVPSTTEYDGIPGPNFWKLVQCLGRQGGYTGPIDGVLGYNSWHGVQVRLNSLYFYSGAYNGTGDIETWKGLQKYAAYHGNYKGPLDGVPGVNTYKNLAYALNDRIALRHP